MTRRIPRKRFSVASDKDQDAVAARLESSRARVKETPISEGADAQSVVHAQTKAGKKKAKAQGPSKPQKANQKHRHISIRVSVSSEFDAEALAWSERHQVDPDYFRKSLVARTRPVLGHALATNEHENLVEQVRALLALPSNQRILWQRTTISLSDGELKQIHVLCGDILGTLSDMRVCSAFFGAVLENRGVPDPPAKS